MRTRSWPLFALLVLVPLASWAWIVVLSRDMYGPMTGASAWMMTTVWDAPHVFLLWVMWAVMMTGMMLPSAAPVIVLTGGTRGYFVALGYLTVWAAFSAGATALQLLFMRLLIVTPMMEVSSGRIGAAMLVVAGVYQLTPLKQACLSTCHSPMAFLTRRWRSGLIGAFRLGVEHGVYCVGCCWALMATALAVGVMNVWWMAALGATALVEQIAPHGDKVRRAVGLALIAAAIRSG